MLDWAVNVYSGPVAIRYPRGGNGKYCDCAFDSDHPVVTHCTGSDVTLITYGTLINNVLEAADILAQNGISATVLRLTDISACSFEGFNLNSAVYVIEEVAAGTGIAKDISLLLKDAVVHGIDLGSGYVTHGSMNKLYQQCGLDAASIARRVMEDRSHEK